MPTFTYYIDRKFTAWDRESHIIEADSKEEADILAGELFQNPERKIENLTLLEPTYELMTSEENNGEHTFELLRAGEDDQEDEVILLT